MTTLLLSLIVSINIVILAHVVIINERVKELKRKYDVIVNKKSSNTIDKAIDKAINDLIDFDSNNTKETLEEIVAYISKDDNDKMVQGNLSALIEEWRDRDKELEDVKVYHDTFENLDDFLNYVSNKSVKVVDVQAQKIRKVATLDRRLYNNKQNVIITFDNGYTSVFKPNLYAAYDSFNAILNDIVYPANIEPCEGE